MQKLEPLYKLVKESGPFNILETLRKKKKNILETSKFGVHWYNQVQNFKFN